ncbi:MAG: c-type cytochrome [Flavobacteriaceae bacterium]|nr:c-type cytochrome [Flavobacteriaceae bacterium]
MKKIIMSVIVFALLLVSCGKEKKEEVKKEVETTVEKVVSEAAQVGDQVALGKQLFTEKTCVSCHQLDQKVVGPSIKDIVKIYDEKSGNLVQFLKGNSPAIVDTDPGQVAIMKANLDGFVKDLSGDQLRALAAYMRAAK